MRPYNRAKCTSPMILHCNQIAAGHSLFAWCKLNWLLPLVVTMHSSAAVVRHILCNRLIDVSPAERDRRCGKSGDAAFATAERFLWWRKSRRLPLSASTRCAVRLRVPPVGCETINAFQCRWPFAAAPTNHRERRTRYRCGSVRFSSCHPCVLSVECRWCCGRATL